MYLLYHVNNKKKKKAPTECHISHKVTRQWFYIASKMHNPYALFGSGEEGGGGGGGWGLARFLLVCALHCPEIRMFA